MCVRVFLLFLFKDPVHNRFTDKKYIGNRTEKKYVGDTPNKRYEEIGQTKT